jgi:3-dehydroquinate synthase
VVVLDEREEGLRAILNLGHTFGHALETLAGYGTLLHGEGVALGMLCAGRLSVQRNLWSAQDERRLHDLLASLGLPVSLPEGIHLDHALAWEAMARDKKARDGAARFVLPTSIGSAEIVSGVSFDEASRAWSAIGG